MTCCLSVPETFLPGFALKVHVLGTLLVPGKPSKEPRDAPFPKLLPKCLPFPKVPCPHLQVPFSFLEADFSPISRPYYVLFPFGGPRLAKDWWENQDSSQDPTCTHMKLPNQCAAGHGFAFGGKVVFAFHFIFICG